MNKFPSTVTIPDATSLTPNVRYDRCVQTNTQGSGTLTINAPNSSAQAPGQKIEIVIKTTNVQTYSFDSIYQNLASGGPTASSSGKTDKLLIEWNELTSKWDIIAYSTN